MDAFQATVNKSRTRRKLQNAVIRTDSKKKIVSKVERAQRIRWLMHLPQAQPLLVDDLNLSMFPSKVNWGKG